MTQEQVAYALNVSAVTVGRWENNYKTPSLEHMVGLAVLFNVSLNTIAGLQEESVLSIGRLSESQRQLMLDIVQLPHDLVDFIGIEFGENRMQYLGGLACERSAFRKSIEIVGVVFCGHERILR